MKYIKEIPSILAASIIIIGIIAWGIVAVVAPFALIKLLWLYLLP